MGRDKKNLTFLDGALELGGVVRRTPLAVAVVGLAEGTRELVIGAFFIVFFVAVVGGGEVALTFLWVGSTLRTLLPPTDEGVLAVISLRRALAAVGAVNLETSDRVEVAFFGFSSTASVAAGGGGAAFLASKATLGTRAGFVIGLLSPATAFFLTGVFFASFPSVGLVKVLLAVVVAGTPFFFSLSAVLRTVVGCLLIGALVLSSLLLLTEETLFEVFSFLIVPPRTSLFFSSEQLEFVTLEFTD